MSELNNTASDRMSSVENSNPRVVPRYHSRLTKLTSRCWVATISRTRRKKKIRRNRNDKQAAMVAPNTAIGSTVKPTNVLASDILRKVPTRAEPYPADGRTVSDDRERGQ